MENLNFLKNSNSGISTLNIIKDNKCVNLSVEEIFDKKMYDHFIGVTYSISSSFVNTYLKDFKTCDIVVGIDDNFVKNNINNLAKNFTNNVMMALKGDSIKLYTDLDINLKEKLGKKEFNVHISNTHIIHSKFYLLWNDIGNTRLIVGSANLSNIAFNQNSNQFENILIFDNNELFDVYKSYYENNLSKVLTNYFSKDLLKLNVKQMKPIKDKDLKNIESIVVLDNESINKIKEKNIIENIEDVREKVALGVAPENLIKEISNISDDRQIIEKEIKEEKIFENIAFEVVKETINKRAEKPALKTKKAIQNNVSKKIVKIVSKEIEINQNISRSKILYDKNYRNTKKGYTGMFEYANIKGNNLLPIGKKATNEELLKSLQLINSYIQSFEKYTDKYTDDYGKRIFECILSIFTASFIHELRSNIPIEENRLDIPQIIILGGQGHSGKSSLLSVMSKLTRGNTTEIYDWKELEGATKNNRKQGRIDNISSWMQENNVNPIFVDEIDKEFFENQKYGREFVLNISNISIKNEDPYPCFFATTNAKDFTFPLEARRRIYYLLINKEIHKSNETIEFYQDFFSKIDNTLYLDFCFKMAERLENHEDYDWCHYVDDVGLDFLYNSRQIFKEYYNMLNLPIPRYFPETKYRDDIYNNKTMWKQLYLIAKDKFEYDKENNRLYFDLKLIKENYNVYNDMSTDQKYISALPQNICVGNATNSIVLELYADEFFDWIEIKNPYKHTSFLDKILQKF